MRAHADDLRAEVEDDALVDAIAEDPDSAPLERISRRAPALWAYARKLTASPADVTRDDVEALRRAGCDDAAIHDAAQVVGFFAYYNRLADGLGVDPEPEWNGGDG